MSIVAVSITAAEVPDIAGKIQKHLEDHPGSELLTAFSANGNVALIYKHPTPAAGGR